MRVQREQIVYVASERQALFDVVNRFRHGKHTRVRFALCEAELKQPRKQGPLPAVAGLCHSVNWFLHATNPRPSVGSDGRIARGRVTIDYLIALKFSLQVGSHKVPPSHAHSCGVRDSSQRTQRGGAHGSAEGLVEVNSAHLCATLNA
eukprot:3729695-Pleurochrysis_carterae.AAC.1